MADLPTVPRQKSHLIKNLVPGLVEYGKIKIGMKGEVRKSRSGTDWQPPKKLDHFLITTMERGPDGNFIRDEMIHKTLGDKPRVIPIRLLYNALDLNFQSRYACYAGRKLFCSGDGETAIRVVKGDREGEVVRKIVECPCERQDPSYTGPNKCKPCGTLSVLIDGSAGVGGVHKLRTTSYNTVVGITSSLSLINTLTGGHLAGIPLDLVLRSKSSADPITGEQRDFWIVNTEFRGSVEELQNAAYRVLETNAKYGLRVSQVEEQARLMLASPDQELIDDAADIVDEFYPEQAQGQNTPAVDRVPTLPARTVPPPPPNRPSVVVPVPTAPAHEFVASTGEVTSHPTGKFLSLLGAAIERASNDKLALSGLWESNEFSFGEVTLEAPEQARIVRTRYEELLRSFPDPAKKAPATPKPPKDKQNPIPPPPDIPLPVVSGDFDPAIDPFSEDSQF